MKKLALLSFVLFVVTLAGAQTAGDVAVTQYGDNGSSPAWKIKNNYNVDATVRFVQPSFSQTFFMEPGEVQLTGNAESYKIFVCTGTGYPTVAGTDTTEPSYSNTPDQVVCK